jgi:sRNA-binding carbon storage regulator CsrA
MLAITRKEGQSVWVGDVEIRIIEHKSRASGVKLGIHAGPEIAIERDELRKQRIAAGRPLTVNVAREMGTKGGAM